MAVSTSAGADDMGYQITDPNDKIFKEVGVDEKLGASIPLDATFTDQSGAKVKLADYFKGSPIVLTLNFYQCPMLCPMTFRNLARTMNEVPGIALGKDYSVVTVSFNPNETIEMARDKSKTTWGMLKNVDSPDKAWPFLFGDAENIGKITSAVGYRFKEIAENNFAHPNVVMIITPDGKISRYLYGLEISSTDLKLALIEASEGKIGSSQTLNRFMMYCYSYDPAGRRYSLIAINVMKLSGLAVVVVFGSFLSALWVIDRRRSKS